MSWDWQAWYFFPFHSIWQCGREHAFLQQSSMWSCNSLYPPAGAAKNLWSMANLQAKVRYLQRSITMSGSFSPADTGIYTAASRSSHTGDVVDICTRHALARTVIHCWCTTSGDQEWLNRTVVTPVTCRFMGCVHSSDNCSPHNVTAGSDIYFCVNLVYFSTTSSDMPKHLIIIVYFRPLFHETCRNYLRSLNVWCDWMEINSLKRLGFWSNLPSSLSIPFISIEVGLVSTCYLNILQSATSHVSFEIFIKIWRLQASELWTFQLLTFTRTEDLC